MDGRLVVNITTSANWRRRPVGIVRVEREITKAVVRHYPDAVLPVYLDVPRDRWMTVKDGCFSDIMSDNWVLSDNPDHDAAVVRNHLKPFGPTDTDSFITVGSDWSYQVPDRVEQLYGQQRVLIAGVHDLIPLLFPEYTPGMEFFDQFNHHYRAVGRLSKAVFANSETSAAALREFWESRGLAATAPPVKAVPLAAPVIPASAPPLDENDRIKLDDIEKEGPFILYVSTLEPRKNHQLLLDIWRDLYAERGNRCPRLVLVGMRGWGCNDLIRTIERMNAARAGKIIWREGLSDALLTQLYARSAFSVFPSYYEGWGLAASEAAALGKVCVVSKSGALIEATRGLMPSYHPLDFLGWKGEIIRLLDDDAYRASVEAKLTVDAFKRTWQDFGDEFCAKLLDS
ncbi:MAG: glycosyltransferase family 4 protein [Sphingobium sp.]